MTRPASTSYSILISVGLLYILLFIVAIFFSNQILATLGSDSEPVSGIAILLGIIFPLTLLIVLINQASRLVHSIKNGFPGGRFKIRLVAFLNLMTIMSTIPLAILFYVFLSGLVKTDLITTTESALQAGVEQSIETYENRIRNLQAMVSPSLVTVLLDDGAPTPERLWKRLQLFPEPPDSLQVFFHDGKLRNYFGSGNLRVDATKFLSMTDGGIVKEATNAGTVLRIRQTLALSDGNQFGCVVSVVIPASVERRALVLSRSRAWFGELTNFKQGIAPMVVLIFIIFMLPLMLISMIAGFFLADEVIRPLVNVEATISRIAKGDFGVRMVVRRHDEMGFIVQSFNRMMSELSRSRDTLKQSERLQTWQDIAQRMAHEIKNPLTPIKLSAQRIQKRYEDKSSDLDQIIRESVNTIVKEVDSLSAMLTEFRSFARLPQPVRNQADIPVIVRETWALYVSAGEVTLDTTGLDPELKLLVDAAQFRQVFKNLFQNAIDAMHAKGKIIVRSDLIDKDGTKYCRLQVSDSGPGVPQNMLKEIFLPYVTGKRQGSGLGLAIVEKIIIDHGGEIRCESAEGHGAAFIMEIPEHG